MYFGWNRLAPEKSTEDGIIPWKLFVVFHAQIRHLVGLERLTKMQGTLSAISMAFSSDALKSREILSALLREAIPAGTMVDDG